MNLQAIREKRKVLHGDAMWRKHYIETCHAVEVRNERERIIEKIDRLAPGLRTVYLRRRLDLLKARLE